MSDPRQIILLAAILGGVGLWLMLPRGPGRGRLIGVLLALVALGLGASQLGRVGNWTAQGVFYLLAGVTIVAALATVTFRSPVYCAIWFGMTLTGTAGLFLFVGAEFLAVATLIVYAGAILVTFLFVLMLAQPEGDAPYDRRSWEALLSAIAGSVLVGILTMTLCDLPATPSAEWLAAHSDAQSAAGILAAEHVARIGHELFGRHLIAVEVAATLLLAAVVGASVIVARKGIGDTARPDPQIPKSPNPQIHKSPNPQIPKSLNP